MTKKTDIMNLIYTVEQILFDLIHRPTKPIPPNDLEKIKELNIAIGEFKHKITPTANQAKELVVKLFKLQEEIEAHPVEEFPILSENVEKLLEEVDNLNDNIRKITIDIDLSKIDSMPSKILRLNSLPRNAEDKIEEVERLITSIEKEVLEFSNKSLRLETIMLQFHALLDNPREAINIIKTAESSIIELNKIING